MKPIIRTSRALKVAGIVLILLSLVLGLYALLNTGSGWNKLNEDMKVFGAETGFGEKLVFDDRYLSALSRIAAIPKEDTDARKEAARPFFRSWFNRTREAKKLFEKKIQDSAVMYLTDILQAQNYLDKYDEDVESRLESQAIQEMFEYINELSAPPKKGGKLASMQVASLEPFFREQYDAFLAENGEEITGSWYEYIFSVYRMLKEEEENGNKIRDPKKWATESFTVEVYQEKLRAVVAEEKSGAADSFGELLADALKRKLNGEDPDFDGMLEQAAEALDAKYPNQNIGGTVSTKTAIAGCLPVLLSGKTSFDGSYNALADYVRRNRIMAMITDNRPDDTGLTEVRGGLTYTDNGDGTITISASEGDEIPIGPRYTINVEQLPNADVEQFEDEFLDSCIKEADNRSDISIISGYWAVAAKYATLCGIGILLLILSRLIRWALFRWLLKTRETAGIQEDPDVLLRVEHLKQYFKSGPAVTKAVDDISFFIKKGEVFGLVGESGCGKTTTGRTIINLYDPTEGNVYFDGLKISSMLNGLPVLKAQIRDDFARRIGEASGKKDRDEVRRLKAQRKEALDQAERNAWESYVEKSKCVQFYREKRLKELKEAYDADMASLSGKAAEDRTRKYNTEKKVAAKDNVMTRMQMIFQDPIASINPRMTVREIIAEGLRIRGVRDKEYINKKVYEMLELVGLVREHADRYPHEFSGGQRQRIGIARAIIMEPDLIIADEPISALDVSIQAQVINLLNDLRERMGLTIMFIAHNLSVVKYFSDRIAVMYFGHIVELATSDELFAHPLHPYTKSLLSAIPYPDPHYEKTRKRIEYIPAKAHDYSVDKPELREIVPGHYIHCNETEYQQYLKEIGL